MASPRDRCHAITVWLTALSAAVASITLIVGLRYPGYHNVAIGVLLVAMATNSVMLLTAPRPPRLPVRPHGLRDWE